MQASAKKRLAMKESRAEHAQEVKVRKEAEDAKKALDNSAKKKVALHHFQTAPFSNALHRFQTRGHPLLAFDILCCVSALHADPPRAETNPQILHPQPQILHPLLSTPHPTP